MPRTDSTTSEVWKALWMQQGADQEVAETSTQCSAGAIKWSLDTWERTIREVQTKYREDCHHGATSTEQSSQHMQRLEEALWQRYQTQDNDVLLERLEALSALIRSAKDKHAFSEQAKMVVACGSGRDRVFMGHSDLPGLGGMTIDAATQQELLLLMQWDTHAKDKQGEDIHLDISNYHSEEFPSGSFKLADIMKLAAALSEQTSGSLLEKAKRVAKDFQMEDVWNQKNWIAYIHAALTYMLSSLFFQHPLNYSCVNLDTNQKLESLPYPTCLRIHVGALGNRKLPHTGGISSSAALTGALSLSLNELFVLQLSTENLITVDYAEYLLGKTSGTSDKAAQLFAQSRQLVASGSLPPKFLGTVKLPPDLAVLMCSSPVPRLSTSSGLKWLKEKYEHQQAEAINQWALQTLVVCGSTCTKIAANYLYDRLFDKKYYQQVGITDEEALLLSKSLACDGGLLLRELTMGQSLERRLCEHLSRQEVSSYRFSLVYKALCLVPIDCYLDEEGTLDPPLKQRSHELMYSLGGVATSKLQFHPRAGALYGLGEMERGQHFLSICRRDHADESSMKLLHLLRLSQLADKACVDYRKLEPINGGASDTSIGRNIGGYVLPYVADYKEYLKCSDETLLLWAERSEHFPLCSRCGAFQRSLPDFDEVANELRSYFSGNAELRVAAAGLGGFAIVYARTHVLENVVEFLKSRDWFVREVHPGNRSQVLHSSSYTNL